MRLSIVIPVFNVEEYIEKCIQSLEKQDIPPSEYEIIIVNDGSSDNSSKVILKLTAVFNNIIFIEQENKGVSAARNAGIDKATGDYLLFIDADDYAETNSFSRVLKAADDQKAQVTLLGYKVLNADNTVNREMLFREEKGKLLPGIEAYAVSRRDGTADPDRSWAILFDRSFLNWHSLRYTPRIPVLEDGEFMARVLCLATNCIFEGNLFYNRTTRPGSAINSDLFYTEKAINGFFIAANNLKQFKQSRQLNTVQRYLINQPVAKFTLLIVQACIGKGKNDQYKKIKEKLRLNKLDKIDIKGCSGIYYKYGLIYNISSDLFYYAWSIRLASVSLNNRIQLFFLRIFS